MTPPDIRNNEPMTTGGGTTRPTSAAADDGPVSAGALAWSIGILLAYFGIRLVYFALNIAASVPPDEVTHAGVCRTFAETLLFPANSPQTYEFGLVTNIPWLYYWIMGKLLHLNLFGLPDLVFLRLLNIPLAFGTVWYALRLLRLLTSDRLAHLLLVAAMTNTPMFSLLSASVSYDNLANLLAAVAIYYLFVFFREHRPGQLAASLLAQLAGALTKVTFLPLVLALGVLLLLFEVKNLPALPVALGNCFRTAPRRAGLSAVLLLVTGGAALQLYAGNYLRFGTMNPSMGAVVSEKAVMESRLDSRAKIFIDYKEGNITYMEALILTGEMKHAGDKSDTFYLLRNYENLKRNPSLWLGPFEYTKKWAWYMLVSIVGIRAHLQMYKLGPYLVPVYLVLGLAALGFLLRWRPRREGWFTPSLLALSLFYAGFVLCWFNYPSYQVYGEPSLTVYGRYLFPVLAPIMAVLCRYLTALFTNRALSTGLTLATVLLFVAYDFPWFLTHAGQDWHAWLPH